MDDESQDRLQKALGDRIREVRTKAGLLQGELAQRAGMSEPLVWRIENGRQNVSLRTLGRLAIGLDCAISELFKGVHVDGSKPQPRGYKKSPKA